MSDRQEDVARMTYAVLFPTRECVACCEYVGPAKECPVCGSSLLVDYWTQEEDET